MMVARYFGFAALTGFALLAGMTATPVSAHPWDNQPVSYNGEREFHHSNWDRAFRRFDRGRDLHRHDWDNGLNQTRIDQDIL